RTTAGPGLAARPAAPAGSVNAPVRMTAAPAQPPVALPVQRNMMAKQAPPATEQAVSSPFALPTTVTSQAAQPSGLSGFELARQQQPAQPRRRATSERKVKAAEAAAKADRSVRTTDDFEPTKLTDRQVDELLHRLIGPLTRLLRTEFRLDRERVGRLRDPRR
ncbi:hypothetical protein, partial [Streptomyces montanisoli]